MGSYQGGKSRLVNVNGSGGAFTEILATIPCRKLTVIEDFSGAAGVAQGLEYQLPGDGFIATFSIAPGEEPLVFEDKSQAGGPGPILGNGPGYITGQGETTGTQLLNLRSATATATVVRVTEFI